MRFKENKLPLAARAVVALASTSPLVSCKVLWRKVFRAAFTTSGSLQGVRISYSERAHLSEIDEPIESDAFVQS